MSALLASLLAQREFDVDLAPGKRLRMRRPAASRVHELARECTPERVASYAVGWSGITEADLLGPQLGTDAPADFAPELLVEVLADRMEWFSAAANEVVAQVKKHRELHGATAKN